MISSQFRCRRNQLLVLPEAPSPGKLIYWEDYIGVEIYLMPVGGKQAREHLEKTILNPVPKNRIREFLEEQQWLDINTIFQGEEVILWGLTPGRQNTKTWNRLRMGDVVIFVPSFREEILVAKVVYKIENEKLAKELWGVDKEKRTFRTWSLIFFVKLEAIVNLDKRRLLDILQYDKNDVLIGNRRITNKVLKIFGSMEEFLEFLETYAEKSIQKELSEKDLEELRKKIEESPQQADIIEFKGKRMKRSHALKTYIKMVAGYKCEACGFTFRERNGLNYVECAHIRPLSTSLEDKPENVAALCPNCHAMLDKGDANTRKSILERLLRIERVRKTVEEEIGKLS
jgi:predicted HNH restriction endonuclease